MLKQFYKYPLYTASKKEVFRSRTWSHEGPHILVSNGGGEFHARIVTGRFECKHCFAIPFTLEDIIYMPWIYEALNFIHLPKINRETVATTGLKHLKRETLEKVKILVPPIEQVLKFNEFWLSCQEKIFKLEKKMEMYETIKKSLLEALFSQKIEVK